LYFFLKQVHLEAEFDNFNFFHDSVSDINIKIFHFLPPSNLIYPEFCDVVSIDLFISFFSQFGFFLLIQLPFNLLKLSLKPKEFILGIPSL